MTISYSTPATMLTVYRRHRRRCKHRRKKMRRRFRHCQCPLWVDGFLGGREIRKSLGLRDWQKAQDLVRQWEAEGQVAKEEGSKPQAITVKEACAKFVADAAARNLREPTIYKYKLLFRQLQDYARDHGLQYIDEFDLDRLRHFRGTWTNRNMAARKKLEALRTFFRFVHESGWLGSNPATALRHPKTNDPPTVPFTREEVVKVLEACNSYPRKANAVRLRALVLLLRHSGLRLGDAVTLERRRIQGDKLFLYTAKTGTPVFCPLPPFVVAALECIPATKGYFFWTGAGKKKTLMSDWQRALKKLFVLAEVPTGHAHRFRHTFAVELLLAGVPMERVSVLLGHQSIRVTEKHYAPWVRARQEQLEADVRRTWPLAPASDGVVGRVN